MNVDRVSVNSVDKGQHSAGLNSVALWSLVNGELNRSHFP